MSYDTFLGAYSTGPDCYERIGDITGAYGRKAVIIGGKTALSKAEPEIRKCASASGIEITGTLWYGGDATYSNAKRLEESHADNCFRTRRIRRERLSTPSIHAKARQGKRKISFPDVLLLFLWEEKTSVPVIFPRALPLSHPRNEPARP